MPGDSEPCTTFWPLTSGLARRLGRGVPPPRGLQVGCTVLPVGLGGVSVVAWFAEPATVVRIVGVESASDELVAVDWMVVCDGGSGS